MDYTMSHPHIISQQGVWRYLSGEWCEGARFESTKKMETTSTYADCTVQRIVTPAQALILFLTRLTPKGRSSRSEFWWVFLVFTLAHFALGANFGQGNPYNMILLLLSYYPFMCLQFRRFHDIGRNTIWVKIAVVTLLIILCTWFISLPKVIWLISLIVNIIAASVILCCDCYKSVPHANEHGEVPHTYADDVAKELAKKNKNRANPKTAASTDVRTAGRYSRLKLHKEAEIAKTTTGTISIRRNTILTICVVFALTAFAITALVLYINRYEIVTTNNKTIRINRFTGKTERFMSYNNTWVSISNTISKTESTQQRKQNRNFLNATEISVHQEHEDNSEREITYHAKTSNSKYERSRLSHQVHQNLTRQTATTQHSSVWDDPGDFYYRDGCLYNSKGELVARQGDLYNDAGNPIKCTPEESREACRLMAEAYRQRLNDTSDE